MSKNESEISELISCIHSFSKSKEEDSERMIIIKSKETNEEICSVRYDRIHEGKIHELADKIGQLRPVVYFSMNYIPSTAEEMTRRLINNSKQAEETPRIFSKIKRLFGR